MFLLFPVIGEDLIHENFYMVKYICVVSLNI
jgi:hypothetical protein